jgi:tetratricopeptide (TPR) repeat protein
MKAQTTRYYLNIFALLILSGILSPVYHNRFKITGTFFNPAPYAGFLMASLPWALLLSSIKQNTLMKKAIYWVGCLSVCLILIAIPSTRSRAAYLGAGTVILVWIFYRYHPLLYLKRVLNSTLKRRMACFIIPLLVLSLCTGLYLVKKDSASGRLLIWKVAFRTVKEQPLTGHGFNTAQATLAPTQARYFAAGNGTENEKMLAGSVRWVFNEFLQTASETGLVGLFLFLLVIGYALFYRFQAALSRKYFLSIGAARASLAGILVFGCFSYPFYSLPVTLLFFFSLAVLSAIGAIHLKTQKEAHHVRGQIPVLLASLLLGVFYVEQIPKQRHAYWLWDEAGQLYQTGAYAEADKSFAEAYPVLSRNGLFLQQYAKSLSMEEKYPKAIGLLNQSTGYYQDEFTGIILGCCYQGLGEYDKAEKHYKQASHMVPHKFYPLYLLAKLYHATGQTEKAAAIAKKILGKAVKVTSKAIEEMKEEMKQLINTNASLQNSNEPEAKRLEACTREQTASSLDPSFTRKEVK